MSQSDNSVNSLSQAVIFNYRLDGKGGGRQQEGHPAMQVDGDGFDWLHLRSDDPGAVDYMRSMNLNPKLIESLSADETRPRMQLLENGVLVNLRGVNTNPGADPEDMVAIRIWFNDQVILTAVRRHAGRKAGQSDRRCRRLDRRRANQRRDRAGRKKG
jgi:zinc transporter